MYRSVPGIASNILRNVSLQFRRIFFLPLLRLRKRGFLHEKGFLRLKFFTAPFIDVQSSVLEDKVFTFDWLRPKGIKRASIRGPWNRAKEVSNIRFTDESIHKQHIENYILINTYLSKEEVGRVKIIFCHNLAILDKLSCLVFCVMKFI